MQIQNEGLRKAHTPGKIEQKHEYLYEFAMRGTLTLTREALIKEVKRTCAMLLGVARQKLELTVNLGGFIVNSDCDLWIVIF